MFRSPRTQPLELGVHPPPEARHPCLDTLCQSLGCTDQLRQAALPEAFPGLRDTISTATGPAPALTAI
jgi:hypothetical protein